MKVAVLNGSPSGESGATAHYTKYLDLKFPTHSFETFEVGRRSKLLSRRPDELTRVLEEIASADAIMWAFPVYTMLVPAQLKLFIELLFEHPARSALEGKLATSVSTSANFYDHTAHDYMHGISSDLGLQYVRGYSAHMDDLLTESGQHNFLRFAEEFLWKIEQDAPLADTGYPPIRWSPPDLTSIELPEPMAKTGDKRVVIVSDAGPGDHNLRRMIELFDRSVRHPVEVVELCQVRIKGGCLGCLQCGDGGTCVYKDDYATAFERERQADIVIYAGAVKDRFFSARFKIYIDRYFSNGHRHVLEAGLTGYLVSGPLTQLAPMRETLEASIEVAHVHRLGIISDEYPDPQATVNAIRDMALSLERWIVAPWQVPQTFLGVGGHKVFRDLVYDMRGVMTADHRFYRDQGLYDFPQKRLRRRIFNRIMLTTTLFPSVRERILKSSGDQRFRGLREVVESVND